MDYKKQTLRQTGQIALGVALCTGVMILVYVLLDKWSAQVAWGAAAGFVLSVGNFLAMALMVNRAADKAESQDVKAGTALMQSSYIVRLLVLFIILVILAKTKRFDPLAMVVPLVFVRPVITVIELFHKHSKEEHKQ